MTDKPHANEAAKTLLGVASGFGAISIWASWMAITRLGVTTTLTASDITMLRFGTAGVLLLPVLIRRGLARGRLTWWQLLILIAGPGAPYTLVAASGLAFAPAADAGVLIPGVMPLFAALLSAICLGEAFTPGRKIGYAFIVLGILIMMGLSVLLPDDQRTIGHVLFLCAAFMFACYAVVFRHSRLDALHAVALVAVGSAVGFLPFYLATGAGRLAVAPWREILMQAGYQGVVATIFSLFLFGTAVRLLGHR